MKLTKPTFIQAQRHLLALERQEELALSLNAFTPNNNNNNQTNDHTSAATITKKTPSSAKPAKTAAAASMQPNNTLRKQLQQQQQQQPIIPERELERAGLCIRHLKIFHQSAGLYGRILVRFGREMGKLLPPSAISVRDIVQVRGLSGTSRNNIASNQQRANNPTGVVSRVTETSVTVAFEQGFPSAATMQANIRLSLLKLGDDSTFQRYDAVLTRLDKFGQGLAGSHGAGGTAANIHDLVFGDGRRDHLELPGNTRLGAHSSLQCSAAPSWEAFVKYLKSVDPVPAEDSQPLLKKKKQEETAIQNALSAAMISKSRQSEVDPTTDVGLRGKKEKRAAGPSAPMKWFNKGLNEKQRAAVKCSLNSEDIVIIHGPPGTGKTTTLIEVIVQAVARGERVLACAPSNIATDNLAEKLADVTVKPRDDKNYDGSNSLSNSNLSIVRVGHPARVAPQILKCCVDALLAKSDNAAVAIGIREDIHKVLREMQKMQQQHTKAIKKQKGGSGGGAIGTEQRTCPASSKRALYGCLTALRKELRKREQSAVADIIKHSSVVLSTCTGAASRSLFHHNDFDMVVIDEAAQALEVACWIPMLKGRKVVLAGDHCQLPPTIKCVEADKCGLGITLFDRMIRQYSASRCVMLQHQYRMHQTIMKWSSNEFYANRLIADCTVKEHLLCDLTSVQATRDTRACFLVLDTAGRDDCGEEQEDENKDEDNKKMKSSDRRDGFALLRSGSKRNPGEAAIVVNHIVALVAAGVEPRDIAVISPYRAQVGLIRDMMAEGHSLSSMTGAIEVGTVDGFQGREKEAIIISMVRSNCDREIGFLSEDRRMNVAITRARRHVCIVCDSSTVDVNPMLHRLVEYACLHGEYRIAEEIGGEGWQEEDTSDASAAAVETMKVAALAEAASRRQLAEHARLQTMAHAAKKRERKEHMQKQRKAGHSHADMGTTVGSDRGRVWSESKIEAILTDLIRKADETKQTDDDEAKKSSIGTFSARSLANYVEPSAGTAWSACVSKDPQVRLLRYCFPASLNSYERQVVHTLAERVGERIRHESTGEGMERFVCVWTEVPAVVSSAEDSHVSGGQEDSNGQEEEEPEDKVGGAPGGGDVQSGQMNKKKKKKKKKKLKPKSAAAIADEKALTGLPRSSPTMEVTTVSVKEQRSAVSANASDADFDAMIEQEFHPGRCAMSSCKKKLSSSFGGHVCRYCRLSYCDVDMNPVFHGCAASVRAAQRSQMKDESKHARRGVTIRDGKIVRLGEPAMAASGAKKKPMSSAERAHLLTKLHAAAKGSRDASSRGAKMKKPKKKKKK